jgi:hypothetical protein
VRKSLNSENNVQLLSCSILLRSNFYSRECDVLQTRHRVATTQLQYIKKGGEGEVSR